MSAVQYSSFLLPMSTNISGRSPSYAALINPRVQQQLADAAVAASTQASTTTSTTTTTTTTTTVGVAEVVAHEEVMDVVVTKIIALVVLTITSVLSGLLPLRLLIHIPRIFSRNKSSLDYILCGLRLFSGGLYLATCFLHLLPDTRDKMAAVMLNMGSRTTYAVPELLVLCGFYAVVFVEQVIQTLYVKAQQMDLKRLPKKSKLDSEAKRAMPIFRSTLDDDVEHRGGSQHPLEKRYIDEEDEDDDDDDNVLIEDEEDLSFEEFGSDNSLDSITNVKRDLNDNPEPSDSKNHHANTLEVRGQRAPQQLMGNQNTNVEHPGPSGQQGPPIMRDRFQGTSTFGPISYQNAGPPIVSCVQFQQQSRQQAVPSQGLRDDQPPPLPPKQLNQNLHPQHFQQQQTQRPRYLHSGQKDDDGTLEIERTGLLANAVSTLERARRNQADDLNQNQNQIPQQHVSRYPHIQSDAEDDSDEEDSDMCLPHHVCHFNTRLDGQRLPNQNELRNGNHDVDVEPGVFSSRREFETQDVDNKRFHKASTTREVNFEHTTMPESSPSLQDLHVRQVVDELSRSGESKKAHFRSIVYIMALSFHGIFEGMALGLQSMESSVWALCFALIVHRCVLAFKLGMDLCKGEEKQGTAFICIGSFTLISTLGIIIGIMISSGATLYSDVTVPEAILQSLATGTIFYIVFFNILFKDLQGTDDLRRVSCSFVGFALMAVVFAVTRS